MPYTGVVFALGALGLAATPGWGSFVGRTLIESAATRSGYGWIPALLTVVEVLVGAAAVAAAAPVFLNRGPQLSYETEQSGNVEVADDGGEDDEEMTGSTDRTPAVLFVPALLLLIGSVAIGVVPDVGRLAVAGAGRFLDTAGYAATVLGRGSAHVAVPAAPPSPSLQDVLSGLAFTVVTIALGLLLVLPRRLVGPPCLVRVGRSLVARLHALHSGHVGDYVTWVAVGTVILGVLFASGLTGG
jgi:multicomponent Na+:H+ antiporter subunit D